MLVEWTMEAALTSALPGLLTLSVPVQMNQMGGPVLLVSFVSITWVVASICEPLPLLTCWAFICLWQPEHLKLSSAKSLQSLVLGSKTTVSRTFFRPFCLTGWVWDGNHISETIYSLPDLFICLTKLGSSLFFFVVLVPGVVPPGPETTRVSERSQTPPGRMGTSTAKPLTSLEAVEGK